jgi:transcriptional regulator with GAF, ATPase, and Fis domain
MEPRWARLSLEGARLFRHMCPAELVSVHLVVVADESEWQNEAHLFDPARSLDSVHLAPDPLVRLGLSRSGWYAVLQKGESFLWLSEGRSPRTALVPLVVEGELAAVWVIRLAAQATAAEVIPEALEAIARWARAIGPTAALVARSLGQSRLAMSHLEENRYFRERERRHYLFKELICESAAMRAVYDAVNKRVDGDSPVLITGEAGTGKELIARALHHLSHRKQGMLISLHCGSLDEGLLDFELFGCVASELAGAVASRQGIFELARDGTVFLDEVDLLSPLMQGKLVRMLKEREVRRLGDAVGRSVNARLIASTHRDLQQLVDEGRLRHEFYLALRGHVLEVPPLRARKEDVLPLARTFLRRFAHRYGARCRGFDEPLVQWMVAYEWPGNVRELQTFVEAVVLKCQEAEIVEFERLRLT